MGIPKLQAVEPITLKPGDKYAIANEITVEGRSPSDLVQDIFEEIAKRFELRRRHD